MGRGDVDDAAPAFGLHAGDGGAHGVEGAGQVDGDDAVPLRDGEILDIGGELHAGIVHQDIQAAQFGMGLGDHGVVLLGLADVGGGEGDFHAEFGGGFGPQRLDLGGVAEAVHHDVGALGRQRMGDAQADAAGRSGDEGDFPLKAHGVVPSLRGAEVFLKALAPAYGPAATFR